MQVLQYFTGTSIAAVWEVASRTITQSLVGGPIARGSSLGGKAWIFLGKICLRLVLIVPRKKDTYSRICYRSMYKRRETKKEQISENDRYSWRDVMP